ATRRLNYGIAKTDLHGFWKPFTASAFQLPGTHFYFFGSGKPRSPPLSTHSMSDIQNLQSYDPFADLGDSGDTADQQNYIHIRIQQRNGRKTLTTIQGLPATFDQKRMLKIFKKDFACNGTLVEDPELGSVIQLQGDQRTKVLNLLVEEGGIDKKMIKLHGF
ncbi:Eukaryotic translation initiation factor eIF-1, partial [Linnemannia gamsii]